MLNKIKENKIFTGYFLLVSLFCLVFLRLIFKSDDGHFMGIISENNFNILNWLSLRYNTISGRTFCELLTASFLKINVIWWKIFLVLLFSVFYFITVKLLSVFNKADDNTKIFVCCIPFLIFIPCLNSSVLWFSGCFTYFVPFVCFLLSCSTLLFDAFELKYNKIFYITCSALAPFVACSQEQSSALTIVFLLVLLFTLVIKKKVKLYHFIPLMLGAVETYFLFTSPGMTQRSAMEAGSFQRFNSMGIIQKLLCGFSNYFAYGFLFSLIVFGLFSYLLYKTFIKTQDCKAKKIISRLFVISVVLVSVGVNACYIIINKTLPDKGFEKAFQKGEFGAMGIILLCLCFFLLAEIFAMIVMIFFKNRTLGATVFLLYAAAVCSSVVVGFSSSIYASGQRIFFFSEIFTLLACGVMYSGLNCEKEKLKVKNVALVVAFVSYCVNALSWIFLETPIMG